MLARNECLKGFHFRDALRRRISPAVPVVVAGIAGVAVGATIAYLYDRDRGRQRRALLRDRSAARLRSTVRGTRRGLEEMRSRLNGFAQHHVVPNVPDNPSRDNPSPDDIALRGRVASEAFRDLPVPEGGRPNVEVYDGVVTLRGEVPTASDIQKVMRHALAIRGVKDVRSFLHLPHTAAPNKSFHTT